MKSSRVSLSISLIQEDNRTKPRAPVFIVQELCESLGGRPGLTVLTNLMVSVDVKQY